MSDENEWKTKAYVAIGSNIENREFYLMQAISALGNHAKIEIAALSGIYETEPVGYVEQDSFLNMVIALYTTLRAEELLQVLLATEQQFGRTRDIRWGPRTLDLDMLLYGDERLSTPDLIIPHPRMHERAFVLVPLAEILQAEHEPLFEFIFAQLEKLEGKEGVVLWKKVQ